VVDAASDADDSDMADALLDNSALSIAFLLSFVVNFAAASAMVAAGLGQVLVRSKVLTALGGLSK